ncbi:hypothetical protein SDC9_190946 [bioreactor metagenome]|uniref:Uncharacterized protein n=1 Tax=bioreactor metagenome TaxID=1076179 RepID=A0A645HWL1_9ZZZZ
MRRRHDHQQSRRCGRGIPGKETGFHTGRHSKPPLWELYGGNHVPRIFPPNRRLGNQGCDSTARQGGYDLQSGGFGNLLQTLRRGSPSESNCSGKDSPEGTGGGGQVFPHSQERRLYRNHPHGYDSAQSDHHSPEPDSGNQTLLSCHFIRSRRSEDLCQQQTV